MMFEGNFKDYTELIAEEIKRVHLGCLLTSLNSAIKAGDKAQVVRVMEYIQPMFGQYRGIIPCADVYEQFLTVLSDLYLALIETDSKARGGLMANIEAWHATNPKFILDLPKLRQIIFS